MSGIPFSKTEDDVRVGRMIQIFRIQQGMSQKDLSLKVGISFQQIQKYETADNRVSVSRLIQIARALDVTASQLLGETAKPYTGDEKMSDMISRMYTMSESQRELIYELVGTLTNYVRPTAHKKSTEA